MTKSSLKQKGNSSSFILPREFLQYIHAQFVQQMVQANLGVDLVIHQLPQIPNVNSDHIEKNNGESLVQSLGISNEVSYFIVFSFIAYKTVITTHIFCFEYYLIDGGYSNCGTNCWWLSFQCEIFIYCVCYINLIWSVTYVSTNIWITLYFKNKKLLSIRLELHYIYLLRVKNEEEEHTVKKHEEHG